MHGATRKNWGGIGPTQNGADLVFGSTSNKTTKNDLSLTFNSINFETSGFSITNQSNTVNVSSKIIVGIRRDLHDHCRKRESQHYRHGNDICQCAESKSGPNNFRRNLRPGEFGKELWRFVDPHGCEHLYRKHIGRRFFYGWRSP